MARSDRWSDKQRAVHEARRKKSCGTPLFRARMEHLRLVLEEELLAGRDGLDVTEEMEKLLHGRQAKSQD